jgi:hypothetical protein
MIAVEAKTRAKLAQTFYEALMDASEPRDDVMAWDELGDDERVAASKLADATITAALQALAGEQALDLIPLSQRMSQYAISGVPQGDGTVLTIDPGADMRLAMGEITRLRAREHTLTEQLGNVLTALAQGQVHLYSGDGIIMTLDESGQLVPLDHTGAPVAAQDMTVALDSRQIAHAILPHLADELRKQGSTAPLISSMLGSDGKEIDHMPTMDEAGQDGGNHGE